MITDMMLVQEFEISKSKGVDFEEYPRDCELSERLTKGIDRL
jgi:hypothetical protein